MLIQTDYQEKKLTVQGQECSTNTMFRYFPMNLNLDEKDV